MSATTPSCQVSTWRTVSNLRCPVVLGIAILAVLFSAAAVQEARNLQSLNDPSVWLQLRTGNWILDQHSLPRSGLFSRSDTLNWADSNWGSQVILASLYRILGLRALPVIQMVLRIVIAIATFLLAGGRRGGGVFAVVLSVWAQATIFHPSTQPLLLNAVLFSVELWALFASRATGRRNLLSWMPVLMLVWANLDWHFVFGLLVLLIFLCAVVIEQALRGKLFVHVGAVLAASRVTVIAVASFLASLLTPYWYHSYAVAWQKWFGESRLAPSPEMHSLNFRAPENYLLMLLVMFSFLSIGRQHGKDLFKVMLLAVCTCLGFAFQREAWTIVIASVAILGSTFFCIAGRPEAPSHSYKLAPWATGAIVLIVLGASASRIPSQTDKLLAVTAENLPVRACDFIRQNHLPGPIFNERSWGSFLTWYLPNYPVSIDERYELYGEEGSRLYNQAMIPSPDYPALASANTILVSKENGMVLASQMFPNAEAVFQTSFPGFQQVYSDDLAVVWSKLEK